MRFAYPSFILLLLVIPLFIYIFPRWNKKRTGALVFSSLYELEKIKRGWRINPDYFLTGCRLLTISLLIFALARPQAGQKGEEVLTQGISIVLVLDTSGSMRAEDFKPHNRLDAAKKIAREFIQGRKYDQIGVVVFSSLSFTQCPLTIDYGAVLDFLDKVEIGMTQTDGTAIGIAISTAVNRLKDNKAKSKVNILLTDGRNNMGEIDPITAAKAADAFDIKIYTVGAGRRGRAPYPIDDPVFGKRYVYLNEDLDEETLTEIARLTKGLYFRATDTKSLETIFEKIDKMEKTEIKVKEYTKYTELFPYFLWPAFGLFFLEIILGNTILRRIP